MVISLGDKRLIQITYSTHIINSTKQGVKMGAKANIVVDQGTDFATTITVRDNSGVAVNLTNYTWTRTNKKALYFNCCTQYANSI